MKKQTWRLKNRARRLKNWILTGVVATLSHSLTATTPFGVTMRLRLATPTGLAATLSQLLSATAPFGALGAVEKNVMQEYLKAAVSIPRKYMAKMHEIAKFLI